jgi:putative nucleotidyltransferase-like protein
MSWGELRVTRQVGSERVHDDQATTIVRGGLRDPSVPFPASIGIDQTALVAVASHHRVLVLLGSMLRAAGTLNGWPPEFIEAFLSAERKAVALDCIRQVELMRVLTALGSARVRALPFKGATLAHTHYPTPHLRGRTDADLLVAAADVPALEHTFARLGYVRPGETSGHLVSYQSHYVKSDRHGVVHALDVHWKISDRQALADRLTFEELWDNRVAVPALGVSAATVSPVHALLLALVHRAGHHPGSRDLLWIYDLHLLASRLIPDEMRQVHELAAARGLSRIAGDGLALAREVFGTAGVDRTIDALRDCAAHQEGAAVIRGPWNQADVLRLDLGALPDWRARGRLLREHLLPSASYIRGRYGVRSNLLLPGLYLWRVLRGAPKWLRSRAVDD